ncbi:MAG: glycosyltransferase [Euryarchaeota archaeon]|nr:glycosyltransferase [Euryarchaeota archaeon]
MRILRVAQKIYPDVKGGGPYHVHAMSRDQAAMGHDVTVVTVAGDSMKPHTEQRDGYTLLRYPSTLSLLGNDISTGVGQHLLDAKEFDVIHAHSHLYFSTNLAALKRRFSNIPLAITNHGLYSQNAPEWVFEWYLRTVGRWTFNRADVVFCYTEEDRERVQRFGVESNIEVVSNGIDTERFRPDGPASERIDYEGPVVLFVGRLVEGKRPGDAVVAMEEVRREHPDARLYLCGKGPLRGDLEAQISARGLGESSAKWVEPDSVLVAMYGSIGKLGINTRAITTNQAIAFANPKPIPSLFLFYYLMASRSVLIRKGKGGTQTNISQTVIKAFPFKLLGHPIHGVIVVEFK